MKIYLASPFFTEFQKALTRRVLKKIRNEGNKVYAPYEHEIENAGDKTNEDWGREVFFEDIKAIQQCDEVWAINFGMYSDSGTAWECGYAYGIGKTVRVLCVKSVNSLMVLNGCDEYDFIFNYLYNKESDYFPIEQK
jgi:nucleoside 2-deoxyribosyltransferase